MLSILTHLPPSRSPTVPDAPNDSGRARISPPGQCLSVDPEHVRHPGAPTTARRHHESERRLALLRAAEAACAVVIDDDYDGVARLRKASPANAEEHRGFSYGALRGNRRQDPVSGPEGLPPSPKAPGTAAIQTLVSTGIAAEPRREIASRGVSGNCRSGPEAGLHRGPVTSRRCLHERGERISAGRTGQSASGAGGLHRAGPFRDPHPPHAQNLR